MLFADDPEAVYENQTAGHRMLADVLAQGARAELVPLMWTLAETGKLTGRIRQEGDDTAEQVREALEGWVHLLGLGPAHRGLSPYGTMLTVSGTRRVGPRRIALEVRADLLPEDAEK